MFIVDCGRPKIGGLKYCNVNPNQNNHASINEKQNEDLGEVSIGIEFYTPFDVCIASDGEVLLDPFSLPSL